jgi:hypothetical protein
LAGKGSGNMRTRKRPEEFVTIHEAGHAVACFLTAETMGRSAAEAVSFVEMYRADPDLTYPLGDGERYYTGGIVLSPLFSKQICDACDDLAKRDERYAHITAPGASDREIVEAARIGGANINSWAMARTIFAVGGAVAEAKARRVAVDSILFAPGCHGDKDILFSACDFAKLSTEQLATGLDIAIRYLQREWRDLRQWNALRALARALPAEGRMEGRECWAIYSRALESAA